jgi:hypothetical protein
MLGCPDGRHILCKNSSSVMKTQFGWTIGMVEQERTNTCDGVRYFLRNPLMFAIQCLLIFELTPSVQAQTPEDPNPNSFDYSITNSTITITRYTGTGGDVTIPSMIDDLPVTSIGPRAFQFKRSVTSVAIPESVTSMGEEAFVGCTGLTNMTIPDSATSIGERAFDHCTGLTSVTIGNSVTSMGGSAFAWCSGLNTVAIPDSVTNIGDGAFSYCTGLATVTIPDSVTSIGDGAFHLCRSLTNVTLPNSVTSIGYETFSRCTGLRSVTIGDSVTSLGWMRSLGARILLESTFEVIGPALRGLRSPIPPQPSTTSPAPPVGMPPSPTGQLQCGFG